MRHDRFPRDVVVLDEAEQVSVLEDVLMGDVAADLQVALHHSL